MASKYKFYLGYSEKVLKDQRSFPNESVDLIVTSPPYSDRRSNDYGGVKSDKYVEWFLPISSEMYRILKPQGSLVINIKEHVEDGERQTYVIELILEMKKQGWRWVDEYCWYKKTAFPGKWPNRFRDSFERCLHFTKNKQFYMDQDAVKVKIGDWADKRFRSMSDVDFTNHASKNNKHLNRKVSNWLDKQTVYPHNVLVFDNEHYPTNVLEISPVTNDKNHSACFPIELPTWFILLLSPEGGLVVDPFSGIGTTALACMLLKRDFKGVEKEPVYVQTSEKNLKELTDILKAKAKKK
ncbi:MAG: hypothetical protein FD133_1659 [Erysipelotrichaceae bacterium]|nr:MAG: hypothetical protein FD133_1659 [Erysipelotrichaceae bacterium]